MATSARSATVVSSSEAENVDVVANDAHSMRRLSMTRLNLGSVGVVVGPAANEGTMLVDSATYTIVFVPAACFSVPVRRVRLEHVSAAATV